jgi:hypothetical protein
VKQISQRFGNLQEVLDEMAAIASKTEKPPDLLNILRGSPVKNSLNSFWVNSNAIFGNHMTKISHLR